MTAFQIFASPDIVDVLRHEQIQRLGADVQGAGRDHKKRPLAALRQAVHRHQFGESATAHPAVRNSGPDGDAVALDLQVRGEQLDRSIAELDRLGLGHSDFDDRFAALSDALRDHFADQERDEFPLLRRHMMASAMQDARILAPG